MSKRSGQALKLFGQASNQVIGEMIVDGGGHFRPAVIDGVHTCLYYYRSIQHIAVPWVIQYNTENLL